MGSAAGEAPTEHNARVDLGESSVGELLLLSRGFWPSFAAARLSSQGHPLSVLSVFANGPVLPSSVHSQRTQLRSWRDPAGKSSIDARRDDAASDTRYSLTWGDQAT